MGEKETKGVGFICALQKQIRYLFWGAPSGAGASEWYGIIA
jgi:hypothetical protein